MLLLACLFVCFLFCSATDRVTALENELASAEKSHEDALTAERRRHEREIEKLRNEWVNQKTVAEERINKLAAESAHAKVSFTY